ncbi:unnamed protein product [Penicillium nalgiovense]|uniref:Major facilitator superfamily (MFS) profile domain-containing protein n=1 Tax=Penicillium nalgiovense TaxID=60175 RepID=A0A9W4HN61_PENNA|nr:unnamed protein product [Penicillium nalgiovense]CAG8096191.1 unnamed protein product [Penicillium nalgiovense]CAG8097877.1 unnamed protein product [Penicillium nalgiovense]CAG8101609.1 unnamed protein product [Penicillium nalgiovense]CAG8106447.1 unnamed protein product [Penicillium nalgiovense]
MPKNFPPWRKWVITIMLGMMTICVTFGSSVFSTATKQTARKFNVSSEVMVLAVSLFVLGFAFGPIIFGPLSELYGRKRPLFVGMFVFAIFQIPVAVAQNLQTIFICRFLGGLFASAPLAIVSGILADMFEPVERGIAMAIFATATFVGPVAGPIIGGFVTISYLGWRWTEYITAIWAFATAGIGLLVIPETFEPTLLVQRAKRLRHKTKNWALHAKTEEKVVNYQDIAARYLLRPFQMLAQEPILLLVTLYTGFIYAFLYTCFVAYPISFQEERGWNGGVGALPFVAVICGVFCACLIIIVFSLTRYRAFIIRNGRVKPEERLIPMILGGILLPVGMFWFGWTSNPHITWVPQVVSGSFLGSGVILIFLQGLNYIIDVYPMYANSAIAANSFFRSWLGAGFPMFASAMFHTLGVPWAMTLLGCLTTALFPVPIVFYIYGPKIRSWSRFTMKEE